jgi:septum formation protein
LILASRSPQRRAILERLGVSFSVRVADVVELSTPDEQGDAGPVTVENALRKARAVAEAGDEVVLGCDTVVVLDGHIYGKPADEAGARRTLRTLAGRTHEVTSGLAVLLGGGEERTAIARTEVTFRALDDAMLDWYVSTGEWRERAGGYAIQGAGAALVHSLKGEYENVVGLPVATLIDLYPALVGR